jgi:hypothetical protein
MTSSASGKRWALSRRDALLGLAALTLPAFARLGNAADDAEPEKVLEKQHGLVRLSGGVWGLPLEAELKEKLASLPILRESVVTTEKDLEERAAANRRAWVEAAPALEALRQALGRLSPSDPKRVPLAQQLATVEATACEPARLSASAVVRAQLIAFSRDRSLLQLSLLWIRAQTPRLEEEYARVLKQPGVMAALKQLGERLGPQKNYVPEVKRLAEYDKLVFTSWLPVYQQAGQTRLAAILNEQAPVTFTWSEECEGSILLPASVLESCGLTLATDAPTRQLKVAGRSLTTRELILPVLRLGRHVVKNLAALVLPPEGEDLGARLPRNILSSLRVNIELERLRMTVSE